MSKPALSISEVISLHAVVIAASGSAHVRRAREDGEIDEGTCRSIGDRDGNHLQAGTDVRDAYLRVTLRSGWDAYWPVAEVQRDWRNGLLAFGDE